MGWARWVGPDGLGHVLAQAEAAWQVPCMQVQECMWERMLRARGRRLGGKQNRVHEAPALSLFRHKHSSRRPGAAAGTHRRSWEAVGGVSLGRWGAGLGKVSPYTYSICEEEGVQSPVGGRSEGV